MAQRLRKFVSRAPRYILRPEDRSQMRFSLEDSQGPGGIENTFMLNLSETGVAFLVDPSREPKLGDRIKVEVPIPLGEQIAWWATVVRIEIYEPRSWFFSKDPFMDEPKILVGLRFDELPGSYTRAIRSGIEKSFIRAMQEQRYRNWAYYKTYAIQNTIKIIGYALLAALAFGFIYWFTIPDAKYDAKRGAPWGDRFKIF